MRIVDYVWTPTVNHALVLCDCTGRFAWPLNVDLITCPRCGAKAWTHEGGRETWRHLYAPEAVPPLAGDGGAHQHSVIGRGGLFPNGLHSH